MKTVITRPYEFLVRWKDGIISGAHVGFEDVIMDDGKELGSRQSNVVSVAIGESKGFPIADILDQISIDALKERDSAIAEKQDALKTVEAQMMEIDSLKKATE